MRQLSKVGLAVALIASTASASFAQGGTAKPWEWGFDFIGLMLGMDDPSSTSISVGPGNFRAGMFVNDQMSVELAPLVDYFSSGGSSVTIMGASIGVVYNLKTDRTKPQIFIHPAFGFVRFSSGGTSSSSKSAQIGVGVRKPMWAGKLHGRVEATFIRGLEDPGTNDLSVSAGVSVIK